MRCLKVSIRRCMVFLALSFPITSTFGQGTAPKLKELIRLIDAGAANDSLATSTSPGVDIPLQLRVLQGASSELQQADLAVGAFAAQSPAQPQAIAAKIRFTSDERSKAEERLKLTLTSPTWFDVQLQLDGLRAGTTYRGRLVLAAGNELHSWELTIVGQSLAVLAVDPIGPVKLVTFPPCDWFGGCFLSQRSFPVTLRNTSEGPLTDVTVRFEPPTSAGTKGATSNLFIDSFSFAGSYRGVDLAHRNTTNLDDLSMRPREQRTILAQAQNLAPGEYSGALRFSAVETAADLAESRLPIAIQVRHHWVLPFVVILLGSVAGWFGSKYVVAARKARTTRSQLQSLQDRCSELMGADGSTRTWHIPTEATSHGLARIRVMLKRLSRLSSSPLSMLTLEEDIGHKRQEAERRIAAMEAFRKTRESVGREADGKPAAQQALGKLLRAGRGVLDGPTFGDVQQAELTAFLQATEIWTKPEKVEEYRKAVLRRRNSRELPTIPEAQSPDPPVPISTRLVALIGQLPSEADIAKATELELEGFDRRIARLALLWRDRGWDWADDLVAAEQKNETLENLFRLADEGVWKKLTKEKNKLGIERANDGTENIKAFALVPVELKSDIKDLPVERLIYHPFRVRWRIVPPEGEARTVLTDGLKCIQYFPVPGEAAITASLVWDGEKDIEVATALPLTVVPDPDRRLTSALSGWEEFAVVGLATLFAAATALNSLYDASFGSFSQYLALFLWAAGAGTGGNIFKEMGTTGTAGGRPDSTLPAKT